MNRKEYQHKLEELFVRFPSVQKTGFGEAYKPGLEHMEEFDALLGRPSSAFRTVHVAGTNGKGSVANMMASALAATGLKVGLYTSPHILDFRERMRILDGGSDRPVYLISEQDVWDFITREEEDFKRLDLSFFEITTGMAFWWFAKEKVDIAVIEVGLGGRLDSTNIITPEVAVVTSIGLDHCAQLGGTRAEIAGEKAGIFKPGVPAVVGTRDAETGPVFEARANAVGCPLAFANEASVRVQDDCSAFPPSPAKCSAILPSDVSLLESIPPQMDLQGEWQAENLRTVLVALGFMGIDISDNVVSALEHTASRMDFHGRWEMLRRNPDILCDIGHNPPALKRNFAQLEDYLAAGRYDRLVIVYGVMADKDLDGILPLMPREATYIAVAPDTPRAMKADVLYGKLSAALPGQVVFGGSVAEGLRIAFGLAVGPSAAVCSASHSQASHADPFRENAAESPQPILHAIGSESESKRGGKILIYIGGSTFVVSEAVTALAEKGRDI